MVWWGDGESNISKEISNSTQFKWKLNLKLEVSLAIQSLVFILKVLSTYQKSGQKPNTHSKSYVKRSKVKSTDTEKDTKHQYNEGDIVCVSYNI